MSGSRNKNLIFYSLYPNDKISRQCLQALENIPELNKQFIKFCVHDPNNIHAPPKYILPKRIQECTKRGLIPIIAAAGFSEPVFADAALSWIKETALTRQDVMPSNIHGQGAADNCCTIEQASQSGNSLFDTDYNIGFSSGEGEFNKAFASIDEACKNRIITYDEQNDKGQASQDSQNKLDQLKASRDNDIPRAMGRMGGPPQGGGNQGGIPQMPIQMQQRGTNQQRGGMPQMPMAMQHQGGHQGMQHQQGGMPRMPIQRGQQGMPMQHQQQGGMPCMPIHMQQRGQQQGNMPIQMQQRHRQN